MSVEVKTKRVWNKVHENDSATVRTFLTFCLAGESFAIDVNKVNEILEVPRLTKVPRSADFLIGVFNLRGRVLPVVDGRIKFGIEDLSYSVDTCVLVVDIKKDNETTPVGFLVDSVDQVIELTEKDIDLNRNVASKYRSDIFDGTAKWNKTFVNIVKLDVVVSSDQIIK